MSIRSNFHLKVVCVPGKEHRRVDTISRLHQPGHLRWLDAMLMYSLTPWQLLNHMSVATFSVIWKGRRTARSATNLVTFQSRQVPRSYTRKLYLGAMDANRITYSKNPIGSYRKDGNEFKIGLKNLLGKNQRGGNWKRSLYFQWKIHY